MSNKQQSKIGLVVGRMNPPHKGHQALIDTCFKLGAEKVGIILGECDIHNRENPFRFRYREELLHKIYGHKIICLPLYNYEVKEYGIPGVFGKYLFDLCKNTLGKYPDIYVYGAEEIRKNWFDDETIKNTIMVQIPRTLNTYSGTQSRKDLLENNKDNWKVNHDKKIWDDYNYLRKLLLNYKE